MKQNPNSRDKILIAKKSGVSGSWKNPEDISEIQKKSRNSKTEETPNFCGNMAN